MFKKQSFLSRVEPNDYLTNNRRPQKHYSHSVESKKFDQALILLKKLVFYSKKQLKMVKDVHFYRV